MIQKILAKNRHYNDFGSLKTYWLFSFSDYQDKENIEFGTLRVFNDDVVMPGAGFPEHFHDTYEIVTIVLEGELSHKDSMGNEEIIKAGEIQHISAGTGIKHSEFNHGTLPVHLYQIWFYPMKKVAPSYEQKLIKDIPSLTMNTDSSISLIDIKCGESIRYNVDKSYGLFVYIIEGMIKINNEVFTSGDQARITNIESLKIIAEKDMKAVFIKVKV